jgi:hypothetical protein
MINKFLSSVFCFGSGGLAWLHTGSKGSFSALETVVEMFDASYVSLDNYLKPTQTPPQ